MSHGCWGPIFFFFNDTATTEIYTLSLHDALPIYRHRSRPRRDHSHTGQRTSRSWKRRDRGTPAARSEEHTSELQSLTNIVCRLLLEKKKTGICVLWSTPSMRSGTSSTHTL